MERNFLSDKIVINTKKNVFDINKNTYHRNIMKIFFIQYKKKYHIQKNTTLFNGPEGASKKTCTLRSGVSIGLQQHRRL